jgi:hypothetical protein
MIRKDYLMAGDKSILPMVSIAAEARGRLQHDELCSYRIKSNFKSERLDVVARYHASVQLVPHCCGAVMLWLPTVQVEALSDFSEYSSAAQVEAHIDLDAYYPSLVSYIKGLSIRHQQKFIENYAWDSLANSVAAFMTTKTRGGLFMHDGSRKMVDRLASTMKGITGIYPVMYISNSLREESISLQVLRHTSSSYRLNASHDGLIDNHLRVTSRQLGLADIMSATYLELSLGVKASRFPSSHGMYDCRAYQVNMPSSFWTSSHTHERDKMRQLVSEGSHLMLNGAKSAAAVEKFVTLFLRGEV